MGYASAITKPASQAERLLETDSGTVYILRDIEDMGDFKASIWLVVLVSKHKTRAFEQHLGHQPISIADYGKVLLRSGEPITLDRVAPLVG
jgi:hypothetical protein